MKLGIFFTLLALCCAQTTYEKKPIKKSYVCPPHFIRLSHRCYYFSKIKSTWTDAYFTCRDLHGNLAIVRNKFQNKMITNTLKNSAEPFERWLGGQYDWHQMSWKWAASGKILTYDNFYKNKTEFDQQSLKWNCIFADPRYGYRWNADTCLEKKHFICHTKIKLVSSKGKKKLLRQYNVDKFNKLNEIPVPPTLSNATNLKVGINSNLNANFAFKPRPHKRSRKNRRRKLEGVELTERRYDNGTASLSFDFPQYKETAVENKRNRRKNKDELFKDIDASGKKIRWKSYYKDSKNPLYPRPIVQEYTFSKE